MAPPGTTHGFILCVSTFSARVVCRDDEASAVKGVASPPGEKADAKPEITPAVAPTPAIAEDPPSELNADPNEDPSQETVDGVDDDGIRGAFPFGGAGSRTFITSFPASRGKERGRLSSFSSFRNGKDTIFVISGTTIPRGGDDDVDVGGDDDDVDVDGSDWWCTDRAGCSGGQDESKLLAADRDLSLLTTPMLRLRCNILPEAIRAADPILAAGGELVVGGLDGVLLLTKPPLVFPDEVRRPRGRRCWPMSLIGLAQRLLDLLSKFEGAASSCEGSLRRWLCHRFSKSTHR